ncbi:MAG: hypothetical protein FJ134_09780 [Deltaproteobacteria bacterium]|nr:hypothetical protein [Deltaproteobacteria bacterium]
MRLTFTNLSLVFSAGALGGLINSLGVWTFGIIGIPQALGVKLAPALSGPWLYQRLVWGGLWGLLFLLPLKKLTYPWRGLVYSLAPTLGQLFVVFPYQAQKGVMGLQLGYLTPGFVIFYNAVWGLAAGLWLHLAMDKE